MALGLLFSQATVLILITYHQGQDSEGAFLPLRFISSPGGPMNILVSTDRNIHSSSDFNRYVSTVLTSALDRYKGQITRIEVHVGDENGTKVGSGDDKRCLIEVKVAHLKPIVVHHNEDTVHQALDGAVDKLVRAMDSQIGKLAQHPRPEEIWEGPTDAPTY